MVMASVQLNLFQELGIRIAAQLGRKLLQQPRDGMPDRLRPLEDIGAEAGAAGIADFLLALGHIEQILRHGPPRAEQVDLEDALVAGLAGVVEDVLQRVYWRRGRRPNRLRPRS
jgi:hypothetical protein